MSTQSHPMPRFVHLRLHSAYSLLEGAFRIKSLPELCLTHNMPALAITDTGNLFGALEFSETLAEAGIQPIVGCSLAMSLQQDGEASADRRGAGGRERVYLALLAQSGAGYANLMKLTSMAFMQADGADPAVTPDQLEGRTDGIICLTGGPDGPLNRLFADGQIDAAHEFGDWLHSRFGDRLYVELQRHGLADEAKVEGALIDFAYDRGIPLVATNEPFFASAEEYEAHDALLCIAGGNYVIEDDRRRATPEHRFKSQAEMAALFADLPEAIDNTIEVAKRCAFRARTQAPILPNFESADGMDEEAALRKLAVQGLDARLSAGDLYAAETEYRDRLDFELDVISNMGFPGYFLIVADFIQWAKEQDIPVGPGRGSGAGSVVAWALTITDLDPLRFGLLFERFLNPERVSMPDFDIDFCQDRRDEVIRYVQQKYGHDHVAQIITFGKLQARAVLRDVGRVLQMPYGQVDRLCKLVPNNPASPVTLKEAIDGEPRLQEAQRDDETVDRMLNIGLKLEGLYRHASTHAAGVVIGDRPLDELVPLYRDPRSDMPVTQFSMKWVEPAGLVKFDFLGLKTLTVLQKATQLLAKRGIKIDLSKIPLDDEATYEMLSRGDATGVFQLESSGMRDTLRRLKPDCIEDIIALVALYRPGPMDNIPLYTDRKAGKQEPDFLHPLLEPILKETHGVIIYQEQVMQIAQVLSGYSLGEADLLRRAMGKKIKSEMDKQKERFVSGAVDNGVKTEKAAFIFELVEKFAGYGFNKSHAAAYAIVAYQTAFLKANHPVEFLAASMTLDLGNTDKLNVFRQEALRVGIPVELPNVNRSGPRFGAEDGKIQYALGALKNVGRLAMEGLANERIENGPFVSLADFASRIDSKMINKRALESLIKAGALDGLHTNRAQLMGAIEAILGAANRAADDRQSNQQNLFGEAVAADDIQMPDIDEWLPTDRLAHEFEAAGFYLSGHPLDDYQSALRQCRVMTIADLHKQGAATAKVNLAGMVLRKQERKSKSGNSFAFVELSDPTGRFEGVIFSDLLNSHRQLFEPGTAVVVGVEAEKEGDDIKLRFQSVRAIDDVTSKAASGLRVFAQDKQAIEGVKRRLPAAGRGVVTFVMMVEDGLKEVELELPGGFAINPKVRGAIKSVPGVLEVEDL